MALTLSPHLSPAARAYRLPWHVILIGDLDVRTRRSFAVAGALGLLVLCVLLFAPAPVREAPTLEAIPERLARLILEEEKPKPAAPAPRAQASLPAAEAPAPAPKVVEPPKPAAQPAPRTPERAPRRVERVAQAPRVAPDQGLVGRREAEAATQALASTSKALDATLAKLSSALPAGDAPAAPTAGAARGRLRRGRGQEALSGVESGVAAAVPASGGPVLLAAGLSVDIGEWSAGGGTGGAAGGAAGGRGAGAAGGGNGEIRSNASLLAVLQRYAPGIRYCYDNALKRDATLGGKLVLRLTVEADGSVSETQVLEDGLKSSEVLDCVLAQVKAWDFGAVPAGRVSFRSPFVFTPGQ
jgi:protein TonB